MTPTGKTVVIALTALGETGMKVLLRPQSRSWRGRLRGAHAPIRSEIAIIWCKAPHYG